MSASIPPLPPQAPARTPQTGAPPVRTVFCQNCGGSVKINFVGRTVNVVCGSCGSILDAADPNVRVLQGAQDAIGKDTPVIPLGTRGKWRGQLYEAIGYQKRSITVEGQIYSWAEYVLFNPYRGYRYLTEYDGHWNDATPVTGLPELLGTRAVYLGRSHKHFQTATAVTRFVLGEFPWQVRVGDRAGVKDYVSPPYVLSQESVEGEITWTLGEYVLGSDVWRAFNLPGKAPAPVGVYLNQPSPSGASWKEVWLAFVMLVMAVGIVFFLDEALAGKDKVVDTTYRYTGPAASGDSSFVTPVFELKGRTSDVEIRTETDASNQWIFLNYALINNDTGQAYDLGREVSYYSGYDSDGSWSEGSKNDSALVPSVPSGRYYLRVEPEGDASLGPIRYTVIVSRDVPPWSLFLAAFGLLLVPPILMSWRTFSFERRRWAESDHPMVKTSSDDDD
ncbi:MAG: DUF4178 domain-containing protein [Bryobacteraceae bacterium]